MKMKTKFLSLFLFLLGLSLNGQDFKEVDVDNPFIGVAISSTAIADVDNDGSLDIFVTSDHPSATLYVNDGKGNYQISQEDIFIKVGYGSCVFFDIDNDGDKDLFTCGGPGIDFSKPPISLLYKNNGFGDFSLMLDPQIVGVHTSSIVVGDFDR